MSVSINHFISLVLNVWEEGWVSLSEKQPEIGSLYQCHVS